MTFAQWYNAIQCLDRKSSQAQALIDQHPEHFAQLTSLIKSQLKEAAE